MPLRTHARRRLWPIAILTTLVQTSGAADMVEAKSELAPQAANLVTRSSPRTLRVSALGLREAGLVASPFFGKGDELRIFASADKMDDSPAARIWINSGQTNLYWFHTGGRGSAEGCVIPKGAAVAVLTKASTNAIAWKNPLTETKP